MSLQPSLTGLQPSPIVAVALSLASVFALSTDSWRIEIAGSILHIALLVAIGRTQTITTDPVPALSTT
jgi:hypothetical protein